MGRKVVIGSLCITVYASPNVTSSAMRIFNAGRQRNTTFRAQEYSHLYDYFVVPQELHTKLRAMITLLRQRSSDGYNDIIPDELVTKIYDMAKAGDMR